MQTREAYVKDLIRRRYRRHAPGGEWGGRARALKAGYGADCLDAMPESVVERWAGCGNVVAGARLTDAAVILDLGAGAGLDGLLLAASPTRPLVITVDLTPEMLAVASPTRDRILQIAGDFERLPLADEVADLVVANAALNLALEPAAAFAEAWRVLRPGGRLHICELVREGDLPSELLTDPLAWSTSLGGVMAEHDLMRIIENAGFSDIGVSGHRTFHPVVAVEIDAIKPPPVSSTSRGLH